jgi:hypothetical protein
MSGRSSKHVKDVGGNDNIKETTGGYFYQIESENDPLSRKENDEAFTY